MLKNFRTGKKARFLLFSIVGILVVLYIFWVVSLFTHTKKNTYVPAQVAPTITVILPTHEPLVTPTILPSSRTDLKTFIFSDPGARYSFNYPATWNVVEIGHDNIVRLNFAGHCKVEFSSLSNAEETGTSVQTKVTKTYAGRTFQMTTFKNNNVPDAETYSLVGATTKDGFAKVNVTLPATNISQCQQTIDQILSSLTFGK